MKQFIKKHIKKGLIFALLLVSVYACQDNTTESLFNESATKRINKKETELRTALKASPNGWKVTYFPDNTQLGGYTFLFNFKDDKNVKMDSDFGKDTGVETSEYDVIIGATLKLSFTTENKIHELSDSNNYPDKKLKGKGYKGNFEFLYYGKDGDDLIFRTNRSFIKLRFKKATKSDWDNLKKNKITEKIIEDGGGLGLTIGDKQYKFSYKDSKRLVTNRDGSDKLNFGVGFTPTGIIISPAIEVKGKKYSEFTFNKTKKLLISSDGNFTIYFLTPPFNLKQEWTTMVNATDVSPSFLPVFNKAKAANTKIYTDEVLAASIYFGNIPRNPADFGIGFFSFNDIINLKGYWANLNLYFETVIIGKSIELNIKKGDSGSNWSYYKKQLEPMVNFIVDNAPYKIEATPLVNPKKVKLISSKNANNWFIIKRK